MKSPRTNSRQAGFSLVEVILAVGILAFCICTLLGVMLVGLRENKTAASQSSANSILSTVVSDLRATPHATPPGSSAETSYLYKITIPANPVTTAPSPIKIYLDADGVPSTSRKIDSIYLLTVSFLVPLNSSGLSSRLATLADVKISWPAAATAAIVVRSVETLVALDRN